MGIKECIANERKTKKRKNKKTETKTDKFKEKILQHVSVDYSMFCDCIETKDFFFLCKSENNLVFFFSLIIYHWMCVNSCSLKADGVNIGRSLNGSASKFAYRSFSNEKKNCLCRLEEF